MPRVSSVRWLLKLYSVVVAGLGLILSLSWTCFHLYVLSVTSLPELRQHRCCNADPHWISATMASFIVKRNLYSFHTLRL